MAWFNNITGGIPKPPSANTSYPSGMMQSSSIGTALGTSLASAQAGSIVAVNGGAGQNYWAAQNTQTTMTHQNTMYVVKQYADAIGWDLTHHHLPVGMTSDDPKIAILKIATIGEVIKDVGVRASETDYYVMREPSK